MSWSVSTNHFYAGLNLFCFFYLMCMVLTLIVSLYYIQFTWLHSTLQVILRDFHEINTIVSPSSSCKQTILWVSAMITTVFCPPSEPRCCLNQHKHMLYIWRNVMDDCSWYMRHDLTSSNSLLLIWISRQTFYFNMHDDILMTVPSWWGGWKSPFNTSLLTCIGPR